MGRRVVRRRPGGPRVLLSLFVAVFPSEEARDHLRLHLPPSAARRPDKWHVTCAFLGEVSEEDTGFVERALAGVPAPGPINLRLAGGGRFGAVVWAGLAGDTDRLTAFREDMRSALLDAGFPIDERPFRPHLTISYRYDRQIATALDRYSGPPWPVDEFALVRSTGGDYQRIWDRPTAR